MTQMAPKRVILRLQHDDFPDMSYSDIVTCVKAFLAFSGRPAEETEQNRHFWHFQPPQPDLNMPNPRFHIIIDLEKREHSGLLQPDFPHELYRVRKVEDKIHIIAFKRKEEHDNFIRKLRFFADGFYPWGEDIRQAREHDHMT